MSESNITHTPAYRKRNVDLYKLIKWNKTKKTKWDKDDIIKAARSYLLTGTFVATARDINVPVETIRNWAKKDWWPILLEEVNYLKNIETEGQLTKLFDKALAEVDDRLTNGEMVLVKGELIRKPVSVRDAALTAAIIYDKRALHRGDPTQIQQKNFNVDERLGELKDIFDGIAKRNEEKVVKSLEHNESGDYSFDHAIEDIDEAVLVEAEDQAVDDLETIKEELGKHAFGTNE